MRSISIILTLLIFLLLCSPVFSQRIQKEGLPPDFNCTGCVLVVLKKEPGQNIHKMNEMVEKKLIKNYEGKSIFVTATDLDTNSLYADKNIYRFLLDGQLYSVGGSTPVTKANGSPGTFNYTSAALGFHLYDRLTKKGYPQISNWGPWAKNMEKIAEALNKLLKNK